jgi:hypothetical protein
MLRCAPLLPAFIEVVAMNLQVLDELRVYIDPLTPDEHDALERSILAEGCRDALVVWGDVLVDGHNRHGICVKHGLPFQTVQNSSFKSMDDVHLWMIEQHLGRRSVSDFQRGVLALRKKDILAARKAAAAPAPKAASSEAALESASAEPAKDLPPWADPEPLNSREAIAKAARISSATVSQIEKIQKTATPELVAAVKAGDISINAAAAVASLPVERQVAAVAGGKKELQQAAREVREAKSSQRAAAVAEMLDRPAAGDEALPTAPEEVAALVKRLRQTIADLSAENTKLKAEIARQQSSAA